MNRILCWNNMFHVVWVHEKLHIMCIYCTLWKTIWFLIGVFPKWNCIQQIWRITEGWIRINLKILSVDDWVVKSHTRGLSDRIFFMPDFLVTELFSKNHLEKTVLCLQVSGAFSDLGTRLQLTFTYVHISFTNIMEKRYFLWTQQVRIWGGPGAQAPPWP